MNPVIRLSRLLAGSLVLASLFMISCNLETLRAPQKGSFPLSEPADPWSTEPVEVVATLLLFPWEEQGRYYWEAVDFTVEIQLAFQGADLPHIGVIRATAPMDHLEAMRHLDNEPGIRAISRIRDTLTRYFGATHVLTGVLRVDDEAGMWHYDATLGGPAVSVPVEKTFTVPVEDVFPLAAQVSGWISESLGDLVSPDDVERIGASLRGPGVGKSYYDPVHLALVNDLESSKWKELLADNPHAPYLSLVRASHMDPARDGAAMRRLAAEPLPAGSHPFLHMARGYLLREIDPRAALHEWEILAARYPGVEEYSYRLPESVKLVEQDPEDILRRVELWHERAPSSANNNFQLAMAYHQVARKLRGTGWASEVPRRNWPLIQAHSSRSVELITRLMEAVGPLPIPAAYLFDPLALAEKPHLMQGNFRNATRVYPYHYPIYANYLNFLKPRWSGSEAQMLGFIEQTLERHPNWPEPAYLTFHVLWAEASLEVTRPVHSVAFIAEWLKSREAWKTTVRKSMNHARGENATAASAAWAFTYAFLLEDFETMRSIARDHPYIVYHSEEYIPDYIPQSTYLWHASRSTYELGLFAECLHAVETAGGLHEEILRPKTIDYETWAMRQAASLAFLGRAEESEPIWKNFSPNSRMQPHRLISWAAANHRIDEVLAEVEPLAREKPDDIQLVGAYALALAQSGEKEKAREVLATVPLFEQGDRWTYLKNAARKVVLGEE